MSTVHLRKRKGKNGHSFLALEFYPPYFDPKTRKTIRYEFLHMSVYTNPETPDQRRYNADVMRVAEAIRCKRTVSIANLEYGFFDKARLNEDFVKYFQDISKSKNQHWRISCRYFETFVHGKCKCKDVTVRLAEDFRDFLLTTKSIHRIHKNVKPLHPNTAAKYYCLFRTALRLAYRDGMLKENVNEFLDYLPTKSTTREFLTLDEVKRLNATPCMYDVLKNAAMFSIFTGLRFSDIRKLDWEDVKVAPDGKPCLSIEIQKTREKAVIFVSDEALSYCGERRERGLVFPFLRESMTKMLTPWLQSAGISKHITFHCFRHTNATLLASMGVDIYTVKDQLAHSHVKTTEIYAKLVDSRKRIASEMISLK